MKDMKIGKKYLNIDSIPVIFRGWTAIGEAIFEHENPTCGQSKVFATESWPDYRLAPIVHKHYIVWSRHSSGKIMCHAKATSSPPEMLLDYTFLKMEEVTYTENE